jgi:methyl-accepting chemotaxis protein
VNAPSAIPEIKTFLLHHSGLYLTNADSQAVMRQDFFTQEGLENYRNAILGSDSYFGTNGTFLIHSTAIPAANWYLVSLMPTAAVYAEANQTTRDSAIIAALFITLIMVIIAAVIIRILKPIVTLSRVLKDISEGEGDLTKSIEVRSHNEIGELAVYFNLTLEKIRNMVTIIKQQAGALHTIGEELFSHMRETAAVVQGITATIQQVKARTLNQSAGVTETRSTMEQMSVNIDKLNTLVATQTESVSLSSRSIDRMIANVQSVSVILEQNSQSIKSLAEASGIGHTELQNVSAAIQDIARESEGLLEINSVMQNIASQTNLLSMNAAIEAAHAGDAGKGFAVVAEEIRKLAENSSVQSKTISTVLKKIKNSIDTITDQSNGVLNRFELIEQGIQTVSGQAEEIRASMTEQGQGNRQLLEVTGRLEAITAQVKNGSEEMFQGSREVIAESRNLASATQEIADGMNEMSSGADQINDTVAQINRISEENKNSIDTLVQEVSWFKV